MADLYEKSLSTEHISANLASYESGRTGFFSFVVHGLDNIIKPTYSGNTDDAADSDKLARAEEYLRLNVVKAKVPHFSLATLQYRRGNDVVKFAGVPTFDSGSITVDDVVGLNTKSILLAWRELAYNTHTRKGGRMVDYKKEAELTEYTQDMVQIRKWKLHGCWISALNEGDFDKENDGKRQITATVEYDRAELVEDSDIVDLK